MLISDIDPPVLWKEEGIQREVKWDKCVLDDGIERYAIWSYRGRRFCRFSYALLTHRDGRDLYITMSEGPHASIMDVCLELLAIESDFQRSEREFRKRALAASWFPLHVPWLSPRMAGKFYMHIRHCLENYS
jgi:hypothetical protein